MNGRDKMEFFYAWALIWFFLGFCLWLDDVFLFRRAITTYEEAEWELSLIGHEALWLQIEQVLYLSLVNLGLSMPRGHYWTELAVELHAQSQDCLFLLNILTDIIEGGVDGEWTIAAIRIIHSWQFPSSSLGTPSHQVLSAADQVAATLTGDSIGILAVDEIPLPEENQRSLEELGGDRSLFVMIGTVVLIVLLTRGPLVSSPFS